MSKKLFISYHSSAEDTLYKNLLVGWSFNDSKHFDIKFDDKSVGISINSNNANYIKNVIKAKIKESQTFLLLIGKDTHKSDWCKWEIDQAIALKKKIVAVKIKTSYSAPSNILNIGANWAISFTYASIKKAID